MREQNAVARKRGDCDLEPRPADLGFGVEGRLRHVLRQPKRPPCRGVVQAWVGQIVLKCNVIRTSSKPRCRLARPRPHLVSCLMTRRHPGPVS